MGIDRALTVITHSLYFILFTLFLLSTLAQSGWYVAL